MLLTPPDLLPAGDRAYRKPLLRRAVAEQEIYGQTALPYKAIIAGLRAKHRELERRQEQEDPLLLAKFKANKDKLAYHDIMLAMQSKTTYIKANRMGRDMGLLLQIASKKSSRDSVMNSYKLIATSPVELFKSSMIAYVFPDRIELKGSVKLGQSSTSPDKRVGPRHPENWQNYYMP
ncbi:hypothetical protein ACFLVN_04385 [Chloroflexota bacterium]